MAERKTKKTKVAKPKKEKTREVSWVLTVIMSAVFGQLGVDRFIMGHIGWGILKLVTLGGLGIWWLIDLVLIATKHEFKGVKWVE
ncbi:MAG: TM2 domain-containing protein [Nanoarchaeota archaeon]|nr:TM2 domain-containing protein [Nanoarchaeota archaeon]